uniref:DUF148 domain-containing protein n=1 Tax=Parascaris univalens TaxID=6257 RepID=A0A915BRL2_PARUN
MQIMTEDLTTPNEAPTSNDEQVPHFIKNLNTESLQELEKILQDSSITKQQQEEAITEWANKQGGEIQEEVKELHNVIETMNTKIDESDMDDVAKDAAHKMQAVFSDMGITVGENAQKLSTIMNSLSTEDQGQVNEFLFSMIKPIIDLTQSK